MLRNKIVLSLTLLALLLVSSAGFGGDNDPPGPPGAGGRVVSRPGRMVLTPECVVISTDNDPGFHPPPPRPVPGDPFRIPKPVRWFHVRNVPNWDEASKGLSSLPKTSIELLVLSGHGSGEGGVVTRNPNTHLSEPNLQAHHIQVIRERLKPNGMILILGCHAGTSNNLIKMAKKLNVRVVANTGAVRTNNDGEGDWIEFCP